MWPCPMYVHVCMLLWQTLHIHSLGSYFHFHTVELRNTQLFDVLQSYKTEQAHPHVDCISHTTHTSGMVKYVYDH